MILNKAPNISLESLLKVRAKMQIKVLLVLTFNNISNKWRNNGIFIKWIEYRRILDETEGVFVLLQIIDNAGII